VRANYPEIADGSSEGQTTALPELDEPAEELIENPEAGLNSPRKVLAGVGSKV
jgi:hypothetical protein